MRRWSRTGRRVRQRARDVGAAWEIWTDPEYRRLARSYELPDGSRRIYCYHVRKTAGTSLHLSFMALGGEDPLDVHRRMVDARLHRTISGRYSFAAFNRRVLAQGAYFYGRSHRAAAAQPLPPKTFTVTVLRDPVERVHSYFDYLVTGDDPAMPGAVAAGERQLASQGFDSFLDRVPRPHLLAQLAMFSDDLDISEAVERIGQCSSVFFTEDFDNGLTALGRRLALPLVGRRARVTGRRSSITDGQRERLRTRLEPEYELLRRLDQGRIAGIGSTDPD
jgi:hypothetical protein